MHQDRSFQCIAFFQLENRRDTATVLAKANKFHLIFDIPTNRLQATPVSKQQVLDIDVSDRSKTDCLETGVESSKVSNTRGCCVPPIKKRGEEARGVTTVRGAPQNGDGRFRDHAPDGSAALQNLYFFSNVAPKILENPENAPKKKRATRNRLVYRDNAEGDWASICRTGRIRAADRPKNFNRFESHTQHLSNEDESGRLQPRSVRVQLLTLSCQGIIKTTTQSGSAASQKKK